MLMPQPRHDAHLALHARRLFAARHQVAVQQLDDHFPFLRLAVGLVDFCHAAVVDALYQCVFTDFLSA